MAIGPIINAYSSERGEILPLKLAFVTIPCAHKTAEGDTRLLNTQLIYGVQCSLCQTIANQVFKAPSFPGERAVLGHVRGDFTVFRKSKRDHNREIELVSQNKNAFIKIVALKGYPDGRVELFLQFQRLYSEYFHTFLAKRGIDVTFTPSCYDKTDLYWTKNVYELKGIFRVIADNNTFPEDILEKMEAVVDSVNLKPKL